MDDLVEGLDITSKPHRKSRRAQVSKTYSSTAPASYSIVPAPGRLCNCLAH
jgi:hypothetical protein